MLIEPRGPLKPYPFCFTLSARRLKSGKHYRRLDNCPCVSSRQKASAIPSVNCQERLKDPSRLQQIVQCCLTNYQSQDIMGLPYILGHNDSLQCCNRVQAQDSFCEHTSNRKMTTLAPSLVRAFYFRFCSHLYFDLFFHHFYVHFCSKLSACCWHQQMIATFTLQHHLIPLTGKKKICKQLMSRLPCPALRVTTN